MMTREKWNKLTPEEILAEINKAKRWWDCAEKWMWIASAFSLWALLTS